MKARSKALSLNPIENPVIFSSEEKKVSSGSLFQFLNLLICRDSLGLPKIINSEIFIYTMKYSSTLVIDCHCYHRLPGPLCVMLWSECLFPLKIYMLNFAQCDNMRWGL